MDEWICYLKLSGVPTFAKVIKEWKLKGKKFFYIRQKGERVEMGKILRREWLP